VHKNHKNKLACFRIFHRFQFDEDVISDKKLLKATQDQNTGGWNSRFNFKHNRERV